MIIPEILNYVFFQHALIGSLLVSICCGILGTYIVTRRLVFISGGITHASFGGLGLGFYAGINPIVTAIIFAVLSAFGVQWLSKKHAVREDSAIAVVWALGMALGVIFIFMSPGYTPGLTEFLFGNILTITTTDLLWFGIFSLALCIFTALFLHIIIFIAFDPEFAKVRRLPVRLIEYTMLCFIAIAIVLSIRMIGIVLLMSVLTLPQMISNVFSNNYRKIMMGSIFNCMIACVGGLFLSYYLNVPAGACIVFNLTLMYGIAKGLHSFKRKTVPARQ
ncbi:MAG: metal ABC transporter permease [Bacteroidales bacterium]